MMMTMITSKHSDHRYRNSEGGTERWLSAN